MRNIKNNPMIKNSPMIKNNRVVTNLLCLCTALINVAAFAQTPIAVQESRFDSLSDLSYQIQLTQSKAKLNQSRAALTKSEVALTKSKVELAKLKKQCLENKGCGAGNSALKPIKPISALSAPNNTKPVKKPTRRIQTNALKKLNQLSIRAIINKQVVFQGIEGSFSQGDRLEQGGEIGGGIKIIRITDSSVVLSTGNNMIKTLTMDWIDD